MTVSPDPSVALLEGKLRELSATVVELQCNCQDYRRLAYDADLRVRAHVSQVERSLREALREEAGKLHTNLEAMGEALAQEQTKRTQQLEQLAGELGELRAAADDACGGARADGSQSGSAGGAASEGLWAAAGCAHAKQRAARARDRAAEKALGAARKHPCCD